MATVQSRVVGARESSVFFVVTGLIAEVLFLLFFIYRATYLYNHTVRNPKYGSTVH